MFCKTMPADYSALTISFISQLLRSDEIILKYSTRSCAIKILIDIARTPPKERGNKIGKFKGHLC